VPYREKRLAEGVKEHTDRATQEGQGPDPWAESQDALSSYDLIGLEAQIARAQPQRPAQIFCDAFSPISSRGTNS